MCESLDEMIESLKEIFSQRKVKVILIEGEYNLELEINGIIKKKCIVQLTKHKIENNHELNYTIDDKIISLCTKSSLDNPYLFEALYNLINFNKIEKFSNYLKVEIIV